MSAAPEPHEIFERVRDEGARRLGRPLLELAATALVAGVDVVFGVIALAVTDATVSTRWGPHVAHLLGSLAFGIAFVFIVAGRSELFTENFMVPIAGAAGGGRRALLKLGELWLVSPVLNVLGAVALILIVTTHGVLPHGTGRSLVHLANIYDANSMVTAFASAVAAGALITLMTWVVEGAPTMGVRIATAWIFGALLALGSFNHVIVVTIEWVFGLRYGATHTGIADLVENFLVAAGGNLVGGIGFVTLTRFGQAKGADGRGGDSG